MRAKPLLLVPAVLATFLVAAGDPAGSSESRTVDRPCDAAHDTHYDPPSGADVAACQNDDGSLKTDATYAATYYTNDVTCGTGDELAPTHSATGVAVSGNATQSGTGGAGYLQTCSDGDLPIQGRFTLEGELGTGAQDGTFTADGDKDNNPEQLQGWAQVKPGEPSVTCGKSYAEGGRADAHNQAEGEASQENCG